MALLEEFLAGLNFPPVTLLRQYLEDGIPEDLQSLTYCAPTDWCLKSSSMSTELRDRGNEAYRSKKYDEARKYYSQSIATAPTDSIELALAYGNRSTILQVQMEYELCLLDTNRALDGSLPQSARMTLLERKAMCWEKLQEQNVMRMKLRAGLSNIKLSSQVRANLMVCERPLCYISKVDIDDTDLVIDRSLIDDPAYETKFENEISENLSPKVQQRADEEWGQVFIAAEDIEPGEILSNGDFYALVVRECNQQEYCDYCSVWCKALIPCLSCSQDMYCCVGCREKAYATYHETECKILPLWGNIPATSRQARRLVLRIFLTGTKQGGELTTLLSDPQVYAAMNGNLDYANAQYSLTDYLPILNRFWKPELAKQQKRIREVLGIFTGLRCVRFFGADGETKTQCSGNILTGEELMTILLLAHNYSLVVTQCFNIRAGFWESIDEGPVLLRQHEIGPAVGPWHSFLKHSCDSNVTRWSSGRHTLIRSVRPIKAGEQICLSNALHHLSQSRKDRQVQFKRLWGRECSCTACVEDWPTIDALRTSRTKYLTSSRVVIKEINKMRTWIHKKSNQSIAKEDLKKVLEFCKTVRQYVKEPSYAIVQCEIFLRAAMGPWGNLYFSQEYIASLYNYL